MTSGTGGRVCSRPGSSLTLVGVRAGSVEVTDLRLEAEAAVRLSRLTPGSSLNVWMVRGLLSMTVVVVVTLEEEGADIEEDEGRGLVISRM